MNNIIQKSIPSPHSHVLNSFHLIEKLSKVRVEKHYELISLDVISLFTNIPLDLAIDGIRERWSSISSNTNIPLDEFLLALRLILNSTYFTFNDKIYKQTFGTPMGSPLSPIIADVFCRILKIKHLKDFLLLCPFT